MTATWETLDWPALDRLREGFLSGTAGAADYWRSASDVASYDLTYAQRIGWKWDAVLAALALRGWKPPAGPLVDWGCGSGIAHRCVLEAFGAGPFDFIHLHDRSPVAMQYAAGRAARRFPQTTVRTQLETPESVNGGTLLISHVLNELTDPARQSLVRLIATAGAVIWVEPGTHSDSRALIQMREQLRESFTVIAPCPHQLACGMLAGDNERHWCHHFAAPPKGLKADPNWTRFAQRAGIDLRAVPYSHLVLDRRTGLDESLTGWLRVIGEPRLYKGYARVFTCGASGVGEVEMQKRLDPALFKAMEKGRGPALIRGAIADGRFVSVEVPGGA